MSNFVHSSHIPANKGSQINSPMRDKRENSSNQPDPVLNSFASHDKKKIKFLPCTGSFHVEWSFRPGDTNVLKKTIEFKSAVTKDIYRTDTNPGSINSSNQTIDSSKVVLTKVDVSNLYNSSPYPISVVLPGMNRFGRRYDEKGHYSSFVLNKDTNETMGKKRLYKDKNANENEQMAKLAVLTSGALAKNWHSLPSREGEPEEAMVWKNTPLYDLLMKNAGHLKLVVHETNLDGRITTTIDSIDRLMKNIEKTRNENYNFIDIDKYVVSLFRSDNQKFDDPTNTEFEQYKNSTIYSEAMSQKCIVSFDVDIEFMAPVHEQDAGKSASKNAAVSPKSDEKSPKMSLGLGH